MKVSLRLSASISKYDPEMAFAIVVALVKMVLSHFSEAGIQPVREPLHPGIHLSFMQGLTYLVFYARKSQTGPPAKRFAIPFVRFAHYGRSMPGPLIRLDTF